MSPRRLAQVLVTAGSVGIVATLVATSLGLVGLGNLDRSLARSVGVTSDAVEALAATVEVADELVGEVASTLDSAALGTRAAAGGAEATVEVLDGAADVTGNDVAGSLAAVEDALPALIDVAAVIDSTLGALDRLPLGPTYDPDVPFDDALRDLQDELEGLPSALRDEAALLRDGAVELGDVGRSARFIADDLDELARTLRASGDVLDDVAATADEAARVLAEDVAGMGAGLTAARIMVVLAGLGLVAAQAVPVLAGWLLLDPTRLRTFLDAAEAGAE